MSSWSVVDPDADFREMYSRIPAGYFRNERWFADRGVAGDLYLIDSLLFQKNGSGPIFLALNLYRIEAEPAYFYYIPLLISANNLYPGTNYLFRSFDTFFYDGIPTSEYLDLLTPLLRTNTFLSTDQGGFKFVASSEFYPANDPDWGLHTLSSTSNSLLFVANRFLIKNYRRIYPGVNPELKMGRALGELGATQVPVIYGFFQYQFKQEFTLGIIQELVPNFGTGWDLWGRLLMEKDPDAQAEIKNQAVSLGKTLAELHANLAVLAGRNHELRFLRLEDLQKRVIELKEILLKEEIPPLQQIFPDLLKALTNINLSLLGKKLGSKFKIHGDFHLEQVLNTGEGWKVIDFEGEPLKSIEEREYYDSPVRDLASLLRSADYRVKSIIGGAIDQDDFGSRLSRNIINGYLIGYQSQNANFLPDAADANIFLDFFQIERAVYECRYEFKYRPDWFWIPFEGLRRLIGTRR